jgi:hypothetical protein
MFQITWIAIAGQLMAVGSGIFGAEAMIVLAQSADTTAPA